jgi:hypothetical protein
MPLQSSICSIVPGICSSVQMLRTLGSCNANKQATGIQQLCFVSDFLPNQSGCQLPQHSEATLRVSILHHEPIQHDDRGYRLGRSLRICFLHMTEIQGNIILYLETLPNSILHSLYKSPSSCLVILRYWRIIRLLPELAKHILYRLLHVTDAIDRKLVEGWIIDLRKS